MPKGLAYDNALLALVFNNTAIPNIGSAGGLQPSSSAGSLYLALHTADPSGSGNDQTTNEVAYTGYARVGVARSGAGFTVSTNYVALSALTSFPACTGGSATATYFSVGVASSDASMMLYSGSLTPSLSISAGVTPQLSTGTMITET